MCLNGCFDIVSFVILPVCSEVYYVCYFTLLYFIIKHSLYYAKTVCISPKLLQAIKVKYILHFCFDTWHLIDLGHSFLVCGEQRGTIKALNLYYLVTTLRGTLFNTCYASGASRKCKHIGRLALF